MYNTRVKNRKIKRFLQKIFSITKFKTMNFSIYQKIILLSIILWAISLFLPWIIIKQDEKTSLLLGFNNITLFSNILISLIYIFLLYLLFSFKWKENIKILSWIQIKNPFFITLWNILIILFSVNSIFTINWLKIFYSNISYWNWIILLLISWIIGLLASLKLTEPKNEKIIISENNNKNSNVDNNKNMKLPI